MKILNLKIKNKEDEIVRNINFDENGVSFIYGNIKNPENRGATINSLGKTLLIKFIDYIYGANEDNKSIKDEIKKYSLVANVIYNNEEYIISRELGSSSGIFINNKLYTLNEYKEFFNIERSLYNKQILLKQKANELGYGANPGEDDYISFLRLLNLDELLVHIKRIYELQNEIKANKNNKKKLINFYGNIDEEKIGEEMYLVDKNVETLTQKIDDISEKIEKIKISDMKIDIIEKYENKSFELKESKRNYERLKREYKRLMNFIEDSNKTDISSEQIIKIYKKAKQEIPELVKKQLKDVEIFHKKVFEERKDFLIKKMEKIDTDINDFEKKIYNLSEEIDKLGDIISLNKVYKESITLYQKYSNELQDLRYKEGKLSQIKDIDNDTNEKDINLNIEFNNSKEKIEKYKDLIKSYADFLYEITKSIYDEVVQSYFDISIRNKHKINRPVKLEMNLKGDTGEGVSEVKKNLIDYLLFRYNNKIDILVQDSSCYNGIDPRQVSGMLKEVDKIAKESNKQAIIAINKYQIGEYKDILDEIESNSCIILSENDKLLKFNF